MLFILCKLQVTETKMVANRSPRHVASVYRRLCPAGVEETASALAARAGLSRGPGRPRMRTLTTLMGTGRARGRPRRGRPPTPAHDQFEDRPPTPAHDQSEDRPPTPAHDHPEDPTPTPEDHEVAMVTTPDNLVTQQTDEGTQQTEDSSAHSTPYLRGATRLPSVPRHERRPLIRPAGRR